MPQQPRNAPSFANWKDRAGLLGLKRKGRQLVGPCPSCGGDDRFSVTEKNGRAVFQCRGCNPSSRDQNGRDAALTILKTAGFAEERKHSAKTRQRGKPDMIHVYRDPTGKPYHRVHRIGSGPDKDVWQDAGYEGSFYPYRVEQLPDRSDVPIVIVEGERCADHLVRLEYAAVTWCGGAGQETHTKWGALAGHPVILWPDNDASGTSQRAMQTLAHILDGLGCDLQLVSIPEGKPDKWDAADATDEEIHGLIEEAKPIGGADEFAPLRVGRGARSMARCSAYRWETSFTATYRRQLGSCKTCSRRLACDPGRETQGREIDIHQIPRGLHREGREVPWSVHQTRAGLLWRLRGRSFVREGAPSRRWAL